MSDAAKEDRLRAPNWTNAKLGKHGVWVMIELGIAGFSGSGKTTLVVRLIPALVARGVSVSTIKHTHHSVSLDGRRDLSRRLRDAGAVEVALASDHRFALLHELRGAPEPRVRELSAKMEPVDLLLVEGFKRDDHKKIEVHRPSIGKPQLWPKDPHVIAVASDEDLPDVPLPKLDLDDVDGIADFIIRQFNLGAHD